MSLASHEFRLLFLDIGAENIYICNTFS